MKEHTLWIGPAVALLLGLTLFFTGSTSAVAWTAAVTIWCAVWWIFEPIPIPATSLLPFAIFPLVGVLKAAEVGAAYGDKMILLFMGGLILSSAMERSGAHRRIALSMVNLFGADSGRRLVLGFMCASAGLSMWISNVATALMLLPIVLAVVEKTDDRRLRVALLLGICYASSVGGIGTPIGTPPNLIFMENYQRLTGSDVPFLTWMTWALPIVVLMLPVMALWLTRGLQKETGIALPQVGAWRAEEVRTLAVFATTALLWITRQAPFGGWSGLLHLPSANDASVALLAVVTMFIIPNGRGEKLLDWPTAVRIPWGVLILFGSGIAISKAFASSGLSESLGNALAGICELPTLVTMALICLSVTFLTEITSNTATTNLLMPILAATATAAEIEPRLIMVPAAISASFAFMLPVATPPNAIIFSSEQLTVRDMTREGLMLNLLGAVIITAVCYLQFG